MTEPICLKTYIDGRIDELKDAMLMCREVRQTRFEAIEKAQIEATRLMEIRLEGMNEFRKQLDQQATTFLPKGEYAVQHKGLSDRVDELVKTTSTHVSRAELIALTGLVSGVVSILAMVIVHIMFGK